MSEFFIVNLAISVGIIAIEESLKFYLGENTTESLQSFLELGEFNGTETVEVKVLENTLYSLAFVVGAMGALSDFLED